RVEQAAVGHRLDRLALGEGFGKRDERSLDQRDVERGFSLEVLAGLLGEIRVRDRECGEDVPQELVTDVVGELDGIDCHGKSTESRETRASSIDFQETKVPQNSLPCLGLCRSLRRENGPSPPLSSGFVGLVSASM